MAKTKKTIIKVKKDFPWYLFIIIAAILILILFGYPLALKETNQPIDDDVIDESTEDTDNQELEVRVVVPEVPEITTKEYVVVLNNLKVSPENIEINVGDTVIWENNDNKAHFVLSYGSRTIDSGRLEPGDSYSKTFNESGRIGYFSPYYGTVFGSVTINE